MNAKNGRLPRIHVANSSVVSLVLPAMEKRAETDDVEKEEVRGGGGEEAMLR